MWLYGDQLDQLEFKLDRCLRKLDFLIHGDIQMSKEFDDLAAQVSANSSLLDSATALINGIADRIAAAGTDPAKLSALTNELKAKDDALAVALTANTPSAQAPSP